MMMSVAIAGDENKKWKGDRHARLEASVAPARALTPPRYFPSRIRGNRAALDICRSPPFLAFAPDPSSCPGVSLLDTN